MIKSVPSTHYKPVSDSFDGDDFNGRIMLQVTPQFGNVYIEVATVKE